MSYRLINANNITFNSDGFITAKNIEKMPCIYADLPNGMDGEHYVLEQEPCSNCCNDSQIEKSKWIPVNKQLPKESGKYLVTFGGTHLVGIDFYSIEEDAKKIFEEPEENIGWRSHNVVAWVPLPEPYKTESER